MSLPDVKVEIKVPDFSITDQLLVEAAQNSIMDSIVKQMAIGGAASGRFASGGYTQRSSLPRKVTMQRNMDMFSYQYGERVALMTKPVFKDFNSPDADVLASNTRTIEPQSLFIGLSKALTYEGYDVQPEDILVSDRGELVIDLGSLRHESDVLCVIDLLDRALRALRESRSKPVPPPVPAPSLNKKPTLDELLSDAIDTTNEPPAVPSDSKPEGQR